MDSEALDYVGFYDKPFLKLERLLETYLSYAPRGFRSFLRFVPLGAKQKLYLPREIERGLAGYRRQIVFTEHHESHAASAFCPSPFEEAAILTLDGVGEWATTTYGTGSASRSARSRRRSCASGSTSTSRCGRGRTARTCCSWRRSARLAACRSTRARTASAGSTSCRRRGPMSRPSPTSTTRRASRTVDAERHGRYAALVRRPAGHLRCAGRWSCALAVGGSGGGADRLDGRGGSGCDLRRPALLSAQRAL